LKGGQVLVVGGSDGQNPERLLSSAELFDPSTARWLNAGSIGAPRSQFTLTALRDGRALLTGGLAADGSTVLASTLLYDPVKNVWSSGPVMANARTAHAAAVLADGKVLVSGGADQVGRLASSELLDSAAKSWSETGALTTPRSDHLAISLPSGRILVVAGHGTGDALATAELFDLSAKGMPAPPRAPAGQGRWQVGAGMSTHVDSYTNSAELLPDGRVLVLPTGYYLDFNAVAYDSKLDAWTTLFSRKAAPCNNCGIGQPSPPVFNATSLGNWKVLLLTVDPQKVIAGKAEIIDLKTGKATAAASPGKIGMSRLDLLPDGRVWLTDLQNGDSHAFLYDPVANRWSASSRVPTGLEVQTVIAVPGHRVLVAGSTKAMVFNPASGAWTDAGSFPSTRSAFSATRLLSGDVLLTGGIAQTGTTPDGAGIYAAATDVMRWDHATEKLAPVERMPLGLYYHSSAALADGRVLLAGGSDSVGISYSSDPVARAEIYDPATGAWTAAAPLPAARYQALAVTLPDGRVVLIGGYGLFGTPASLMFTPQS
jgi:N-acetylneuraminic acid mutarotase